MLAGEVWTANPDGTFDYHCELQVADEARLEWSLGNLPLQFDDGSPELEALRERFRAFVDLNPQHTFGTVPEALILRHVARAHADYAPVIDDQERMRGRARAAIEASRIARAGRGEVPSV